MRLNDFFLSVKFVQSPNIENIKFFAEYLVYYEPLQKMDEADAGDVYSFLADWFPRKAM